MLTENDYIFDGFCHRPFNKDIDGWRNGMPKVEDYPSVKMAENVIDLFNELAAAKKELWDTKRQLAMWVK